MGIDVTHPTAGSSDNAPSVAAVTATIDGTFAQYRGRVRVQGRREEIVADLREIVKDILNLWERENGGRRPQNVLVYRDGVSEGQYQDVLRLEVSAIEAAFADVWGKEKWPNFSFVVSQELCIRSKCG